MLILTRRPHEEVYFTLTTALPMGTRMRMAVLGVTGNQVRLGIEAPHSVTVDRAEIDLRRRIDAGEINGNVAKPE